MLDTHANDSVSILIPTSGNSVYVRRLAEDLRSELQSTQECVEVIILDNRKSLEPSTELREIAHSLGERGRYIHHPLGGKSAALNHAIPEARGDILLFLDDDMRIAPGWLSACLAFFRETAYDLMQGRILPDPADDLSPHEYPMVPTCDKGESRRDFQGLGGGNVGGRARWYQQFPFDERLGVGASGAGEDSKFAHQAQDAGARIGYEPKALVYHPLIPGRATQANFRRSHYLSGKSSLAYRNWGVVRLLWNVTWRWAAYCASRLVRVERSKVQRHEAALFRNLGRLVGTLENRLEREK